MIPEFLVVAAEIEKCGLSKINFFRSAGTVLKPVCSNACFHHLFFSSNEYCFAKKSSPLSLASTRSFETEKST